MLHKACLHLELGTDWFVCELIVR